MRKEWCLCAAMVLVMLGGSYAHAAYLDNVTLKTDRGFSNALGCWLEIPYWSYTVAKEKGIAAGAPLGLGKGIVMTPLRLLSGVADLATFYMPCPKNGWDGLMTPAYNPWVEQPEKPVQEQTVGPPPLPAQ